MATGSTNCFFSASVCESHTPVRSPKYICVTSCSCSQTSFPPINFRKTLRGHREHRRLPRLQPHLVTAPWWWGRSSGTTCTTCFVRRTRGWGRFTQRWLDAAGSQERLDIGHSEREQGRCTVTARAVPAFSSRLKVTPGGLATATTMAARWGSPVWASGDGMFRARTEQGRRCGWRGKFAWHSDMAAVLEKA